MTGGGDLDEVLDDDADQDPGKEVDAADAGLLNLDENDTDPTAGASDIGGRAGDDSDR